MRKSVGPGSDGSGEPAGARKRGLSRFSLRRLLYSSPILARRIRSATAVPAPPPCSTLASIAETAEPRSSNDQRLVEETSSRLSVSTDPTKSDGNIECSLCLAELAPEYFPSLLTCPHKSCYDCFQIYLRIEISESRVSIACPQCSEPMHPNDIRMILNDKVQYEKYEDFMVRRVLAVDPDTRWCPAPDCSYAVIAAGCASCPKIKCQRPGCGSHFCYHCKAAWHPNQTCDAARAQRSPNVRSSSLSFSQDSQHRDDIKPCPCCQVLIVKMDDGSCNHMTCAVCGCEFCWLCMKEISDLHYLSPSGCTFWGKKPWSRKKKILWQLGTLVGAPVGIGLVAGIAVPAIIIGIPVWVGRKLYSRFEHTNKHKRNLAIAGGVTASVLVSPVLASIAVSIGVPILLFYVYGVVPISLCRSGGCGVTTSVTGVRFDFDDEEADILGGLAAKNSDGDTVSHPGGNPSIGEVSLSLGSGSQLEPDRESASFVALAGSIASASQPAQRLEVQADVVSTQRFSVSSETASATTSLSDKSVADDGGASTRALAGSMINFKHMDAGSLSNFRAASNDSSTGGEAAACALQPDSVSQRSEANISLSSLEELSTGLMRRAARKKLSEKQGGDCSEDGCSERVRFDDHVSFIDAELGHCKPSRKQTVPGVEEPGCSMPSSSRLEVQADVVSTQRFSVSSETASATTSLSDKSVADDGGASTRALAGSIINFKHMDAGSLSNFRAGSNDSPTGAEACALQPDSVSQRSEALSSLEELSTGLMRRGARKKLSEKQGGDSSEDGCSERVRFDDHVSFIDAELGHCKPSRKQTVAAAEEPGCSTPSSSRAVSTLRSLFFQSPESSSRGLETPPCLPPIPEPLTLDSVLISIPNQ